MDWILYLSYIAAIELGIIIGILFSYFQWINTLHNILDNTFARLRDEMDKEFTQGGE